MKKQIDPDEIFLDSSNLPHFNEHHFEGRLEQPISKLSFWLLGVVFALVSFVFLGKLVSLQIFRGEALALRSMSNTLRQIPLFAERGLIKDRWGEELAWNEPGVGRRYIAGGGFGHLLGYISYPTESELAEGDYHPEELTGRGGIERALNTSLEGGRGLKIEEVDVRGEIVSEYLLREPTHGEHVILSIDARVQQAFYRALGGLVDEGRFRAGAGVMLDVETGELIALVSVPEYDPNVMSLGQDVMAINAFLNDPREPFLNRVTSGLYTPGSIVKPYMSLAALNEGIIDPEKEIYSDGALRLPNPFVPGTFSVFRDWKAHGWVDARRALAVSSNVYFYSIGGGFGDQRGLGIAKINRYAKLFGFGQPTGFSLWSEETGLVPTPEWKAEVFPDDPWRLGDTYHTVIGQYSFQVTPLQMARAVAALATSGRLPTPTLVKTNLPESQAISGIAPRWYQVVREGMRQGVLEGTATGLNHPAVAVAAKTGTAELGQTKEDVNSWVTGFFPYEQPRYAFAVVLERGERGNLIGGVYAMRQILDWIAVEAPEYFSVDAVAKNG